MFCLISFLTLKKWSKFTKSTKPSALLEKANRCSELISISQSGFSFSFLIWNVIDQWELSIAVCAVWLLQITLRRCHVTLRMARLSRGLSRAPSSTRTGPPNGNHIELNSSKTNTWNQSTKVGVYYFNIVVSPTDRVSGWTDLLTDIWDSFPMSFWATWARARVFWTTNVLQFW